MMMMMMIYICVYWRPQYNQSKIGTRIGGLGNKRTSGNHPNYSITEIDQNIKKSPGDLGRFGVTQDSNEKPPANAGVKNSQMSKIIRTRKTRRTRTIRRRKRTRTRRIVGVGYSTEVPILIMYIRFFYRSKVKKKKKTQKTWG